MSQPIENMIDARPIRPISDGTPWATAVIRRDELAAAIREALQREKIEAAVFLSAIGNYPPWVRLEAWLPPAGPSKASAGERERATLEIAISAKPYHEHATVVSAKAVRGSKEIAVTDRPEFNAREASEWTRFALGRGKKPSNYTPGRDTLWHMISGMLPFIPPPHRNRLEKKYRANWTGLGVLGVISALIAFAGLQTLGVRGNEPAGAAILLLGIMGCIGVVVALRRREHHISVLPQPVEMPRNLGLVDSWHAVISDIGRDFPAVHARIVRAVTDGGQGVGLVCRTEAYTHSRPNGYEQRERLVVSKDQGMVHVHIYPFGNDVFVGWQAYLNWSRWGETKAVSTRVSDGHQIEFRDVTPNIYVPNQFDLIDLSSLSEFVHRRLEREIRALLKEKSIDQEIDFKIIRGDRDRALDESKHKDGGSKKGDGWNYKS